jgi:hypothetical protein
VCRIACRACIVRACAACVVLSPSWPCVQDCFPCARRACMHGSCGIIFQVTLRLRLHGVHAWHVCASVRVCVCVRACVWMCVRVCVWLHLPVNPTLGLTAWRVSITQTYPAAPFRVAHHCVRYHMRRRRTGDYACVCVCVCVIGNWRRGQVASGSCCIMGVS